VDEAILDRIQDGVIVVSRSLTPVFVNRSARELLGLGAGPLPPTLPGSDLASIARRAVAEEKAIETTIPAPVGDGRSVDVAAEPIEDDRLILIRTQRLRSQFVAHASHELKTPAASIRSLSEALVSALEDDLPSARRFSRLLVDQASRLGELVHDLLDLSRFEDPANVGRNPVDLVEIAETEVATLEPRAAENGVELTLEGDDAAWVLGDPSPLSLMIRNLVENAILYSPRGSRARVRITTASAETVVEVTDEGAGIALKDQARVFERFFRVEDSRSRDHGGTGLGLAIVKHVVEMHGARIGVRSQLGEGSTFTIRFSPGSPSTPQTSTRTKGG
jgi:signal transduction histidine kinase